MIAKTEMLIRRPVAELFEAFINPDIRTKEGFTFVLADRFPGK